MELALPHREDNNWRLGIREDLRRPPKVYLECYYKGNDEKKLPARKEISLTDEALRKTAFHVPGHSNVLNLRPGPRNMTDGAGLPVLGRLRDTFDEASWLDACTSSSPGHYRLSLTVEAWTALCWKLV